MAMSCRRAERLTRYANALAPWHFLYFLPDPHGHGSLRPTFGSSRLTCSTCGTISSSAQAPPPPPAAAAAAAASALGWSGPPPAYCRLPVDDEPVGGCHI